MLKSWAVPKGPDLDPANKRLAMQVEDHPLEYGGFEGIIPEGEYGGGTVMLWDQGVWEPIGDPAKGFREGHLKFILHGEKLQGAWMLVRKGGRKAEEGERHWFLFKERDEFARPGESITEEMPLSVTTGRDLDEIAAQSDRVWGPRGEVRQERPQHDRKGRDRRGDRRKQRSADAAGPRQHGQRRQSRRPSVRPSVARKPATAIARRCEELLEHPGARRARLAEDASRRAGDARRRGTGRRRLAARDQIRRLSHVMPRRQAARRASSAATATTGPRSFPSSRRPPAGWQSSRRCSTARWSLSNPTAPPAFRPCRTSFKPAEPASSSITYSIFFT